MGYARRLAASSRAQARLLAARKIYVGQNDSAGRLMRRHFHDGREAGRYTKLHVGHFRCSPPALLELSTSRHALAIYKATVSVIVMNYFCPRYAAISSRPVPLRLT